MPTSLSERADRKWTRFKSSITQEISAFRLRNAILLDTGVDSKLSNRYFNSILRLSKIIAESGSRELAQRFETTSAFEHSDIANIKVSFVKANQDAEDLREELILPHKGRDAGNGRFTR